MFLLNLNFPAKSSKKSVLQAPKCQKCSPYTAVSPLRPDKRLSFRPPWTPFQVTHTEASFPVITLWRILGLTPTIAAHPISHFIKLFFFFSSFLLFMPWANVGWVSTGTLSEHEVPVWQVTSWTEVTPTTLNYWKHTCIHYHSRHINTIYSVCTVYTHTMAKKNSHSHPFGWR